MAKPSIKDQLNAQRTANASTQNTPVQSTFRQDEGAEPRVRTSMYLPESLARELRVRAANEGIRANTIVVDALASYLHGTTAL